MQDMTLSQIWVYPVKACQGIQLAETGQQWNVTSTGFELDRQWCVIDSLGKRHAKCEALSQRKCKLLATITVKISEDGTMLLLGAPGMAELAVPVAEDQYLSNEDVEVHCAGKSTTTAGSWHLSSMMGKNAGHEAEEWLTNYLNSADDFLNGRGIPATKYTLVRSLKGRSMMEYNREFPILEKMDSDEDYAARFKGNETRFQDFAPFLLISADSCDWLIEKMNSNRDVYSEAPARPSIVVKGTKRAWDEENWKEFTIGNVRFRKIKECPRCTVPCKQQVGAKAGDFIFEDSKLKPTKTLKTHFPEKDGDEEWGSWRGPFFGVYVGHGGQPGALKIGDKIEVNKETVWDSHKSPLRDFVVANKVAIATSSFAMAALILGAAFVWGKGGRSGSSESTSSSSPSVKGS